MKKDFFICFSLFLIFSAKLHAQRFFVGELEGVAYIVNNGEQCKLTKGDYLDNESRIYIAPKSAIILQDSKKKKLPMIKGPKDGTLESILHNKKGVTYIKCSKEIFDYITGKIFDCFLQEQKKEVMWLMRIRNVLCLMKKIVRSANWTWAYFR